MPEVEVVSDVQRGLNLCQNGDAGKPTVSFRGHPAACNESCEALRFEGGHFVQSRGIVPCVPPRIRSASHVHDVVDKFNDIATGDWGCP